jgi:hypothetical protein
MSVPRWPFVYDITKNTGITGYKLLNEGHWPHQYTTSENQRFSCMVQNKNPASTGLKLEE